MNVVDSIADVNTGVAFSQYRYDLYNDGNMYNVPNVPPGPIVINAAIQLEPLEGDIDDNCRVDFNDFSIFLFDL